MGKEYCKDKGMASLFFINGQVLNGHMGSPEGYSELKKQ